MKLLAVILLACLLASCGSRAIIVKPMAPAVTSARAEVAAAGKASSRVHVGVADVAKKVRGVSIGINEALAQAGTMRDISPAGSPESEAWDKQWKILTNVRTRNLFAEVAADAVVKDSDEAQRLQSKAEETLTELETTAVDHDAGVQKIKMDNAELADDAGTWRSIKKGMWGLIGIGVLALILIYIVPAVIKSAAKIAKPL